MPTSAMAPGAGIIGAATTTSWYAPQSVMIRTTPPVLEYAVASVTANIDSELW